MTKFDVAPNLLKFIAAAVLLAVWGVFAWFGKTGIDGFIYAISTALTSLGVYHGIRASGTPPAAPPPPKDAP